MLALNFNRDHFTSIAKLCKQNGETLEKNTKTQRVQSLEALFPHVIRAF